MPQFDVYRNVTEPGYLLDCQADTLANLNTRLVVPLLPPDYAPLPTRRLNPTLRVGGVEVEMMTHFAVAVPARTLGGAVGSLAHEHMTILNAFDLLLTGY